MADQGPKNTVLSCRIYCTVVSGFESTACDEAREVFGEDLTEIFMERGALKFNIPVSRVHETIQLRAVDNLYVVVLEIKKSFSATKEEAVRQISEIPRYEAVQWRTGFLVWKTLSRILYPEKIFDIPENFDNSSSYLPKFRATCYRTGKHSFSSQEAMANFGGALNDAFSWPVDLKNYDVEANLIIDDDRVSVCLTLTRESLFRRNITNFGPTTLRPSIAYSMIRLGNPKPGEIFCDPMCGSGSIPIEAALAFPFLTVFCGDNHHLAWERTTANVKALEKSDRRTLTNLQVLEMDVCDFPFRSESIDLWVSDFPFGKRHKCNRMDLYPKALASMAKASKEGVTRAVIVTQDRKAMTLAVRGANLWFIQRMVMINLGGLNACVYCLMRTCFK